MLTTLRYWRLNVRLWLDDHGAPLMILGAILIALGLAQLGRTFLPQRATVIISATATPALQLLATPATAAIAEGLPRAVTAYAAPGGAVLGALEPGRPYTIVARAGAEWLMLNVRDSGLVWVRWAESGLLPAGELADLTPPPPATPQVIIVERPAAPQVVYVPAPAEQLPAVPAAPVPPRAPETDVRTSWAPGSLPAAPTPSGSCVTNPNGGGTTCSGTW